MSRGYDSTRSRIDAQARVKWLQHKIHGVLDLSSKSPKWQKALYDAEDNYGRDCFGVGPETAKKMKKHGVVSTFQLFGMFLSFMGPPQNTWLDGANAMWEWLEECHTPMGFRSSIIDALQEKLSAGGLDHLLSSDCVDGGTSKQVAEFMNSDTSRLQDMPCVDESEIKQLNKNGIFTTYQLYGKFLLLAEKYFPDPKSKGKTESEIMDDFYEWLRGIGVKRKSGNKITDIIALKLSAGFHVPIPGFSPTVPPKVKSLDTIDESDEDEDVDSDDDLARREAKVALMKEELKVAKELEGLKNRRTAASRASGAKLMTFYKKYEPSKATESQVRSILEKYQGNESELWARLNRKYADKMTAGKKKATSSMSLKVYLALFLLFCYVWFGMLGMRWPLS
eukprot:g4021.t1